MKDTVECKICGKVSKRLVRHVKSAHNMTCAEYKEQYNSPVVSEAEIAKLVERNKSDKMRQVTINRNKSDEMRAMISERNRDPEFQAKCRAGYTEETRKAQAESMRKTSLECWRDPEYRKRRSQQMSNMMRKLNQDPDYVKIRSDIMKRTWENPENAQRMISAPKNHPYGVQSHRYSDKFNREYYCRSQGESEFVSLCESLENVSDLLPGSHLPVRYMSNGQSHVYIPDFIVVTSTQTYMIEVKYEGDLITNHIDKVNGAVDYCNSNEMIFCYVNRFSGISKIKESGFDSVAILSAIKIG